MFFLPRRFSCEPNRGVIFLLAPCSAAVLLRTSCCTLISCSSTSSGFFSSARILWALLIFLVLAAVLGDLLTWFSQLSKDAHRLVSSFSWSRGPAPRSPSVWLPARTGFQLSVLFFLLLECALWSSVAARGDTMSRLLVPAAASWFGVCWLHSISRLAHRPFKFQSQP
jgi:hypothetical protein